ncbi:MAG: hypothetical protein ACI9FJ_001383 [Alteromonadaceae bacterium]|jgi:hypothetical protein
MKPWNAMLLLKKPEVIDFMSPEAAQSLLMLSAHFLAQASHPKCDKAVTYLKNRLEG